MSGGNWFEVLRPCNKLNQTLLEESTFESFVVSCFLDILGVCAASTGRPAGKKTEKIDVVEKTVSWNIPACFSCNPQLSILGGLNCK